MTEIEGTGAGNGRVLVVDDEAGVRGPIRVYLERRGYRVEEAATGVEAVAAVGRREFDAVLLDVWMPGMNGTEALAAIRAADRRLSVVVMSGMGTGATEETCLRAGAVGYLPKPVRSEALRAAVEGAVSLTRAARHAAAEGRAPGWRGRVLVADDHEAFRRSLARLLRLRGFDVDEAAGGREAVERWRSHGPYDLALLDIRMDAGDGIHASAEIRRIDPPAAIAFMTGEASWDETRRGLEIAPDGAFLRKPFGEDAIETVVAQAIEDGRADRARRAEEEAFRALPIHQRWVRRAARRARRSWRRPDTRFVLAAVLLSSFLSVGGVAAVDVLAERAAEARASAASRIGEIDRMYEEIRGYLDRDEQREVRREAEAWR